MTNLEIIKYLAANNPVRLAELLEDIYCQAWNDGANDKFGDESSILSLEKWLYEDAGKCGMYYYHELEKWNKAINPIYTIDFGGGKLECKDGKLSMQSGDINIAIDQAIDEIKLLENLDKTDKYSDSVYNSFRKEVCADCRSRGRCLQTKMAIVECPRFEYYYEV